MKANIHFLLAASSVAVLAACGGSSSDSSSDGGDPPAIAYYAATDDTAATANDAEVSIDVLDNDSTEASTDMSITEVTEPENGSAVIDGSTIVYTPNQGFAGIDSFTYTGTDGTESDTATVEVTVSQEVTLSGKVVDSPIADAQVTITIGEETFEATTNADGEYELQISTTDVSSNERLKLSARGSGDQSHVTLSARMASLVDILNDAGEDRVLERAESNQVQVTQLTTAENVQLESLANGEAITEDNIQALLTEFDSELMLEMAAAIKLLIDNPDYDLPEGVETIEEFLNDEASYNEMVETASTSGDLEEALEETLNDPEIQPEVVLADLQGAYVVNNLGSRYTGRFAPGSYIVGENTIVSNGETLALQTQNGVWLIEDQVFPETLVNIQVFDLEQEVIDAYLAMNGSGQVYVDLVHSERQAEVISATSAGLTVEYSVQPLYRGFTFSHDGVDYEVPDHLLPAGSSIEQWLDVDSLVASSADAIFDFEAYPSYVLTSVYDLYGDVNQEFYNWGTLVRNEQKALDFSMTTEFEGEFVNELNGVEGTWELSDDKRVLTMNYELEDRDVEIQLNWSRFDDAVTETLVRVETTFPDSESSVSYALQRGAPLVETLDVESLVLPEGNLQLALLNMPTTAWDEEGLNFNGMPWAYGWEFRTSGDVIMADMTCPEYWDTGECAEENVYWEQMNEPSETWDLLEESLHIRRYWHTNPECTGEGCGGRYVKPLRVHEETGIVTVVEVEYFASGSPDDVFYEENYGAPYLLEGGVLNQIGPRINYWLPTEYDGVEAAAQSLGAGKLTDKGYKKVLEWSAKPVAPQTETMHRVGADRLH